MPHIIPLSNAPQGSEEWLQARKSGIGSTDSAAAVGLSQWKTPLQLWEEKTGAVDGTVEDNWYMARGRALEPVIRQHYADTYGVEVKNFDGVLRHPEFAFVLASLDGFTEQGRMTEFKTASSGKGWGEPGSDEIPKQYIVQVQHAMLVTGFDVCDVGVSIMGGEPRYYEVRADQELQTMLLSDIRFFWEEHVIKGIPPEPSTIEEKLKHYQMDNEQIAYANDEVFAAYEQLSAMKETKKDIESEVKILEDTIKDFMLNAGAGVLVNPDGKPIVTWKEGKPVSRFDHVNFRADHYDLFRQYSKEGDPIRRFLVE